MTLLAKLKKSRKKVYFDHREPLYCAVNFDDKKYVILPDGFETTKYLKRSKSPIEDIRYKKAHLISGLQKLSNVDLCCLFAF